MEGLKAVIEALIFASESPLNVDKLADVLEDVDRKDIRDNLLQLVEEYRRETRGLWIVEVAGGYHFRTKNEWSP